MAMQLSTGRPITGQSAASRDRNCEMLHIFSEPESLINVSPKVSIPPLRISAISVWLCQPVYFMRPKLFSARRSKWWYLRGRRKMKIFLFNYRGEGPFNDPKVQKRSVLLKRILIHSCIDFFTMWGRVLLLLLCPHALFLFVRPICLLFKCNEQTVPLGTYDLTTLAFCVIPSFSGSSCGINRVKWPGHPFWWCCEWMNAKCKCPLSPLHLPVWYECPFARKVLFSILFSILFTPPSRNHSRRGENVLEMQNGVLSCQRLKRMRRRSREPQQQQRLQKSQERLREISQRERGRTRGKKGRKQSVRYGNQFLKEWTPFKTDHRARDEEVRLRN